MAWSRDEYHLISDQWRVSSLIRAAVELIVALCVLLCAIVSATTTGLLRVSSGLSSYLHGRGDIKCGRTLRFGDQREDDLLPFNSISGLNPAHQHMAMNRICEGCTPCLTEGDCTLKRSSTSNHNCASTKYSSNDSTDVHSILKGSRGDTKYWPNEDENGCRQHQGAFCPPTVESGCDWSERVAMIGNTSPASSYGCGCQNYNITPEGVLSPVSSSGGRPLKRKFAKIFHSSYSRNSSFHNMEQQKIPPADNSPLLTSRNGYATIITDVPVIVKQRGEDSSSRSHEENSTAVAEESHLQKDFQSDADYHSKFSVEDSYRDSSQESFSYSRRPTSLNCLRIAELTGSRNTLSIDSDLLAGESTPEWNGSFESPHETEEGSSIMLYDDPGIGVVELREALQAEQEALAALYLELENERNASSSAANEAMAMITRLQEEKAAIQMEARQYQRMAEEKQLYDQEATAMLEDILIRRDEEVYALEEELNLYKKKLIGLAMDELMESNVRDRLGSSSRGNDGVPIEGETFLLEGNEDWKNRREAREDKLIADIREWLHAASDRVISEKIEELESTGKASLRGPRRASSLFLGNGRKNLLESFSAVALDESHSRMEDGQTPRDGFEAFRGMMESLRREPSLRDEESLATLKKIEEKFQKQSSGGAVRSGDELRQIWKNTLRSFESTDGEKAELQRRLGSGAQTPITTAKNRNSTTGCPREDVDANRAIEEKRLSVLEYVWKFEEQLHQLAKNKPFQSSKLGSSAVDSTLNSHSTEFKGGALSEFSARVLDSEKARRAAPDTDRPHPIKSRLRKLGIDARSTTLKIEGDPSFSRSEGLSPIDRIESTTIKPDSRSDRTAFSDSPNQEGSFRVYDVYEVQTDMQERSSEPPGCNYENRNDIKKSVSSAVNNLVPGMFIDSQETAFMEDFLGDDGDRLGKPDFNPADLSSQEFKAKQYHTSSESLTMCLTEDGAYEKVENDLGDDQLYRTSLKSATCQKIPESPSSVLLPNSPDPKMEDIIQQLTVRLKSLETDRQMMQHTISSLRRENGEMKLLQEIAQQLKELRGMEETAMNTTGAWQSEHPTFLSSLKGMLSFNGFRLSVQSRLSKLVHLFLGESGACQGEQYAGLCRLLHRSPLLKQQKPLERARSCKATDVILSCPLDGPTQHSASSLNLLTQQNWPIDARERSGTAFSGWDF